MSERITNKWIRSLEINGKRTYMIVDYNFWVQNETDLLEWLDTHTAEGHDAQQGMTVSFANEQEELMFLLRWGK